jgi:hypothetical protein
VNVEAKQDQVNHAPSAFTEKEEDFDPTFFSKILLHPLGNKNKLGLRSSSCAIFT